MRERTESITNEAIRRQEALTQLNRIYPGERKKGFRLRDPKYVLIREEILHGNFDVLGIETRGGVKNGEKF